MSKRENYIEWNEMFMGIASFTSQRSKDPIRQVGAVIVNADNRIVATGYNGMPPGISDNGNVWGKNPDNAMFNKKHLVCHAEANAIANATCDITGCTMYVTHFPCNECAKQISTHGIRNVIYANDYGNTLRHVSDFIMGSAGIIITKYNGTLEFNINIIE